MKHHNAHDRRQSNTTRISLMFLIDIMYILDVIVIPKFDRISPINTQLFTYFIAAKKTDKMIRLPQNQFTDKLQ